MTNVVAFQLPFARKRNAPGRYAFSTYKTVEGCVAAGPGRYSLGDNLYLDVAKGGSSSWVFQYRFDKKQREFNIGSTRYFKKAEAIAQAQDYFFALKRHNIDPKTLRDGKVALPANLNVSPAAIIAQPAIVLAAPVAGPKSMTYWLGELIAQLRVDNKWKGDENEKRYRNSCAAVGGVLMDMDAGDLTDAVVDTVIVPQWKERRMQKNFCDAIKRLYAVWEKAKNNNTGDDRFSRDNPFRIKRFEGAHGRGYKKSDAKPHKALDIDEMPALVKALQANASAPAGRAKLKPIRAAAALFYQLNANRENEALLIRDDEVNLDTGLWTLSPERMKAEEEHEMFLSKQSLDILKSVPRVAGNPYFFAGELPGKPISEGSLLQAIREAGFDKDVVTGHGGRSTFRDWAGELGFPDELCEFQLAHQSGDATKRAYRRKKAKALRAAIMQAYADYLYTGVVVPAEEIVPALQLQKWLKA